MFDKQYLHNLKDKFNYEDKIIKTLEKIIPCVISYYGKEYENLILEALFNCEIVNCSSKQTISKVINDRKLSLFVGESLMGDIDLKRGESIYKVNLKILYDEMTNTYEIEDIDRFIVTSHTFNYDSPKGIEVLTHAICHLIKSYEDEILIDENNVIIRNGLSYEKRKINYGDEIFLEFTEEYGKALEEGFTIYDTEKIVSDVLKDNYNCYDFNSVYTIAQILKEKFDLGKEINDFEIKGDIKGFREKYKDDALNLANLCDDCLNVENEMILSYSREDKEEKMSILNKILSKEVYSSLMNIYKAKNIVGVKK